MDIVDRKQFIPSVQRTENRFKTEIQQSKSDRAVTMKSSLFVSGRIDCIIFAEKFECFTNLYFAINKILRITFPLAILQFTYIV